MNGAFRCGFRKRTNPDVSFVGMNSLEVPIGDQARFNILMYPATFGVNEVVVTAMVSKGKREITYQTQKVDQEELVKIAPTRASSALAGKWPDCRSVQNNGVNPTTQILLRGLRSITGDNSALIVIDGSIASQGAFDAPTQVTLPISVC